jgi:hypothetical protein
MHQIGLKVDKAIPLTAERLRVMCLILLFSLMMCNRHPQIPLFFQQSWDSSKRTQIDKKRHQYTSIYYRPGFYLAKLVVGQHVVKEHPILIWTNGWLGMIAQKPVPVYLVQKDFEAGDELKISPETIISKGLTLNPVPPRVELYNVGNFKPVSLDDFAFSAAVKNDYHEGAAKCQLVKIILITDEVTVEIHCLRLAVLPILICLMV